jgi:hypothetical protein
MGVGLPFHVLSRYGCGSIKAKMHQISAKTTHQFDANEMAVQQ